MQCPQIKNVRLQTLLTLTSLKSRRKHEDLEKIITSRLSQGKHAKNDLYSFVADHLDDPSVGVTTSELWSEAMLFFSAGNHLYALRQSSRAVTCLLAATCPINYVLLRG